MVGRRGVAGMPHVDRGRGGTDAALVAPPVEPAGVDPAPGSGQTARFLRLARARTPSLQLDPRKGGVAARTGDEAATGRGTRLVPARRPGEPPPVRRAGRTNSSASG